MKKNSEEKCNASFGAQVNCSRRRAPLLEQLGHRIRVDWRGQAEKNEQKLTFSHRMRFFGFSSFQFLTKKKTVF